MNAILNIFFVFMGLQAPAHASTSLQLYVWDPGTTLAPLIIPVKASETPPEASRRYLRALGHNRDLMELFQGQVPDLPQGSFIPLSESDREHRALLVANLPKDYTKNSERVLRFKKHFSQGRHNSYILPLNANLGLNLQETQELLKLISMEFPLLVPMGGEDVEPALYKQENIHAQKTIPTRDQFEVALIKYYAAQEKGFILGVCRGAQITSVALGYSLIQDVPIQVGEKVSHSNDWHTIHVRPTRYNILYSLTQGTGKLEVNSLHHQAVIYKPGGPLQLAAQGEDRVTEATEFENGRGLLLQFHPELMQNHLGSLILWKVLQQKNQVMASSCSKIF